MIIYLYTTSAEEGKCCEQSLINLAQVGLNRNESHPPFFGEIQECGGFYYIFLGETRLKGDIAI